MPAGSKKFPLTILIQGVDKATGPMRRVGQAIREASAKARGLAERLRRLGQRLGLGRLATRLRGVGTAAGQVARRIGLIGVAAGLGVAGIRSLITAGDDMAKRAARLKLTINAYSQLEFAAKQSGVAAEKFSSAMSGLSKRVGEAKVNTGSLVTFLNKADKGLLRQIKSAEGTEEAFTLLSDAIAGYKDPAEQAALAAAAFGRSGQEMLLLFREGPKGIAKLRKESKSLTGDLTEFGEKSQQTADAMGRVDQSVLGVKAALITGLAPALTLLMDKLAKFFAENRENVKKWAENFGKKLPKIIEKFKKIFDKLIGAWETFSDLVGGDSNAALLVIGATIAGPLVAAVVALTAALIANPLVALGIAIAAVGFALGWLLAKFVDFIAGTRAFQVLVEFFQTIWDGIVDIFLWAWDKIKPIVDLIIAGAEKARDMANLISGDPGEGKVTGLGARVIGETGTGAFDPSKPSFGRPAVDVNVQIANAPPGTRVETSGAADVRTTTGYQLAEE